MLDILNSFIQALRNAVLTSNKQQATSFFKSVRQELFNALNTDVPSFEDCIIDDLAANRLPADINTLSADLGLLTYVPVRTKGDGNCLYNAASMCLKGKFISST